MLLNGLAIAIESVTRGGESRGGKGYRLANRASVKVLFLLNTLGSGGAESSLAVSLPIMVEDGLEPLVACFQAQVATRRSVFHDQIEAHARIVTIPGQTRLEAARATRELIEEWRPDVVHATLMEANLISRLARLGCKTPLINSLVSMSYTEARFRVPHTNRLKHRALQVVDAVTGWVAVDHFHAVNQAVKDEAVKRLLIPPGRISVVLRGRPAQAFDEAAQKRAKTRSSLGFDDQEFVVISVGRQSFIKGHLDLLLAFRSAWRGHPDLRLVVAGREGDCTNELRRYVEEHGLEEVVSFLGHRNDVPELLAAADLFVFPSHLEGIGGAGIEAMAAGLPVVASDIPGLRETLGPQGRWNYVPAEDPQSLHRALAALKVDPELRASQGRANRTRFESIFEVEPNALKMMELYRKVLTRGPRPWYRLH